MSNYLGEFSALGAALCWSLGPTLFTIASRQIGAVVSNRLRLLIAVFLFSITHFFVHGEFLPTQVDLSHWLWLGLSGIIGLVIGDTFLFQSLVILGPQFAMLIFSIFPILSSVIAWGFLNESLSLLKVLAIGITISGVMLVILGKRDLGTTMTRRRYIIGILFGLGGAIGQALGLILAKKGITTELSGLTVTLIRVLPATIVIWLVALISGSINYTFNKLCSKEGMVIVVASFVGSFAGLWLSMLSIKYTSIGIASTLMALPPVFLLPVSRWVFKEKITLHSIVGTLIAVIGIAMIFLV